MMDEPEEATAINVGTEGGSAIPSSTSGGTRKVKTKKKKKKAEKGLRGDVGSQLQSKRVMGDGEHTGEKGESGKALFKEGEYQKDTKKKKKKKTKQDELYQEKGGEKERNINGETASSVSISAPIHDGIDQQREDGKLREQLREAESQLLKFQKTIDRQTHLIIELKKLLTEAGISYDHILDNSSISNPSIDGDEKNNDKANKRKSWRKSFGEYTAAHAPSARRLGFSGKKATSTLGRSASRLSASPRVHPFREEELIGTPTKDTGGGSEGTDSGEASPEPITLRVTKKKGLTLPGILPRVNDIPHENGIRKWKDKTYDKWLTAASLVEWCISQEMADSPEEALMIGNLLVLSNILAPLGNQTSFEGKKKEIWSFTSAEVAEGTTTTTTTTNNMNTSNDNHNTSTTNTTTATAKTPLDEHKRAKRSTSFLSGVRQRIDKDKKFSSPTSASPEGIIKPGPKHRSLGADVKDMLVPLSSSPIVTNRKPVASVSLEELMAQQKETHPEKDIPVVLDMLCNGVLELGGCKKEGIFRISAHSERVRELKACLRQGDYTMDTILTYDVHEVANSLKQIVGELSHPIIPEDSYSPCLEIARKKDNTALAEELWTIIHSLPAVNQAVIERLLSLLRTLAEPEHVALTKMLPESLAVAFAPLFLRCPDPALLRENAASEAAVVEALIKSPAKPTLPTPSSSDGSAFNLRLGYFTPTPAPNPEDFVIL